MDIEELMCFEYLQQKNPNQDNKQIYEELFYAIPNPKYAYCVWVIDQFLYGQFTLEQVEQVREILDSYIQYISYELPPYYSQVTEELEEFANENEQEELDNYYESMEKKKISDKVKPKKQIKYQR
jgi:hypothetical protein